MPTLDSAVVGGGLEVDGTLLQWTGVQGYCITISRVEEIPAGNDVIAGQCTLER